MQSPCVNRYILLVATFLAAGPSNAQEAFSRISASVGRAENVNRTDIHEFWAGDAGAEIALSTPFYVGEAELGVALHRYDALDQEVPRFHVLFTHLGWRINLSPFDLVSWYNGFEMGNYRMTFDEETFQGVRNESELTLGLQTRFELRYSAIVRFYAAGRYMRTYTQPRMQLAFVSGGVRVTLDSPDWLMTILR